MTAGPQRSPSRSTVSPESTLVPVRPLRSDPKTERVGRSSTPSRNRMGASGRSNRSCRRRSIVAAVTPCHSTPPMKSRTATTMTSLARRPRFCGLASAIVFLPAPRTLRLKPARLIPIWRAALRKWCGQEVPADGQVRRLTLRRHVAQHRGIARSGLCKFGIFGRQPAIFGGNARPAAIRASASCVRRIGGVRVVRRRLSYRRRFAAITHFDRKSSTRQPRG